MREQRSCTVGSFLICTHHQILLGRSNQGEWGGQCMWHAWERGVQSSGGKAWGRETTWKT
jgi:hypothetical protein